MPSNRMVPTMENCWVCPCGQVSQRESVIQKCIDSHNLWPAIYNIKVGESLSLQMDVRGQQVSGVVKCFSHDFVYIDTGSHTDAVYLHSIKEVIRERTPSALRNV